MPSVNSFETDMRSARRKKKARRNIKNLFFILAVVIIAGLIYITRFAWLDFFEGILDRHEISTVQNDGTLAGGNYPIDISKKTHTKIGTISNSWTLFADTTFYVYNSSGDVLYSEQAPYSNPIVKGTNKRVLVYDQGGYNFTVVGPREKIYSKKLTDQILLGAIGSDGSVAIVTANEKFISYLTIYDKSGSEIYHWADGSMITAVDIASGGKGCLVSTSYARGGTFRSVVTRLDFNSIEESLETSAIDTLSFEVKYCSNGFWVLGRDRLCRLNGDGGVEMDFGYEYELKDYYISGSLCALIFEGAGGGNCVLSVISNADTAPVNTSISSKINDVYCTDKTVYILTETDIEAYDEEGDLLATAPLNTVYRAFSVIDDEIYLLGYRSVEKIEFGI